VIKKTNKNPKADRGHEIVGSLLFPPGIPGEVMLDACPQLLLSPLLLVVVNHFD
jgi:hypothetical protein